MEVVNLERYLPDLLDQMKAIATQVAAGSSSMTELRNDFREHLQLYRDDKKASDALIHSLEKSRDISNGRKDVIDNRAQTRPHWHLATGTHVLWVVTLLILIMDVILRLRG